MSTADAEARAGEWETAGDLASEQGRQADALRCYDRALQYLEYCRREAQRQSVWCSFASWLGGRESADALPSGCFNERTEDPGPG